LIFSGSELRSKEEILSSLLGVIPKSPAGDAYIITIIILKELLLALSPTSFPPLLQA
jgi:hypothetical protein